MFWEWASFLRSGDAHYTVLSSDPTFKLVVTTASKRIHAHQKAVQAQAGA